ncbi:MAG: amidohydrolase family protein [Acutalibacteraceae bacterium]|nr:amidohydrolase family protein [Acutalibacteraceae bacterium]
MLIDFHTHCFPDKIAEKAIEKLSFVSGGLIPHTKGTLYSLKEAMKREDVDTSVVLSIATNAHQQTSVNDFAAHINNDEDIIAFGSVYPHSQDVMSELERIKELGLKGVKLHPDYQGFDVDDIKLKPIYKKISELGLITVFHAGNDYGYAPPYGATPEKMSKAIEWFTSPVVVAHWGGVGCGEDVLKYLCSKNVYFDTSYAYGTQPKYYFEKILEKHGADRLVFGTDSPWHTAGMEMRLLDTLKLTEEEKEKICYKNALKLLNRG